MPDEPSGIESSPPVEVSKSPRRIIIGAQYVYATGGTETLAFNLARKLRDRGYDVRLVLLDLNPPDKKQPLPDADEKLEVHHLSGFDLTGVLGVLDQLDGEVLILLADAYGHLANLLAVWKARCRKLLYPNLNNYIFNLLGKDPALAEETARVFRSYDGIAVMFGSSLAAEFLKRNRIPFQVVESGIPRSLPEPGSFRRRFGLPEDTRLLIYPGLVTVLKNQIDLIRVAAQIQSKVTLGFMGGLVDEPYSKEFLQCIETSPNCRYLGCLPRKEVVSAMCEASLCLFPSLNEGAPLTLLESMQHGLPWLATPDVVFARELKGGMIAPVKEFSRLIDQLLSNPGRCLELGAGGKEQFEGTFTIDHAVTRFERVLRNLFEVSKDEGNVTGVTGSRPRELQAEIDAAGAKGGIAREEAGTLQSTDSTESWASAKPNRKPGFSFCIITNGKRPVKLREEILSIRALGIPHYEILVGGDVPQGFDDIISVPMPDVAHAGRLGEMRNQLCRRAKFDHLVVADDDMVFQPDFYRGLLQYGEDYDVLCVRLLNTDGTRFWDWAKAGTATEQRLLDYSEYDARVYVTGGLCVMKAVVSDQVQWDGQRGFYQLEDVDFSERVKTAGFTVKFCAHSTVTHNDRRYTQVGRIVLARKSEAVLPWEDPGLQGATAEIILTRAIQEGRAKRYAECADHIRFCLKHYPVNPSARAVWNQMLTAFGGDTQQSSLYASPPFDSSAAAAAAHALKAVQEKPAPSAPGPLLPVLWHGLFYSLSGYAEEARHFVLNLDPNRVNLAAQPFAPPSELCRSQLGAGERSKLDALLAKNLEPPFIAVVHVSGRCLERLPGAAYCIGRTMFETDRLPPDWVEKCNRMDEIWVPTDHSLEAFRNSGVTARLVKIPGGVDTDRFRPGLDPLPLPGRRKTVFLSIFEWSYRKGWDVLLHAWARAFKPQDDVCLVLRTYPLNAADAPDVSREINLFVDAFLNRILKLNRADVAPILVLGQPIPEVDLPRLYAAADAYVAPSRGEGWGRPQMDAMACGLPVIATGWSGTREFMTEHNSLLVDYVMTDIGRESEVEYFRGHKWAEPSRDHLMRLLRRVAEQPEEVAKIGLCARRDMVERWTWSRAAGLAAERLQEIGQELAGQGRLPSYKRESVHSMNDPSRKPDAHGPNLKPGPDYGPVPPEVLGLLEKADGEYRKGNLAEARSILMEALRITPDSPRILATLGAISFALNDFIAAKDQFARAAALAPSDPGVRVQLALANLEMDQIDEFESALAHALELDPNYRDALKLLADLNLKQGAFKDAAQTYTKIISHHPEDLDSLLGLGACFYKSNDLETAGQVYERILHLSPSHSLATKNLAAIKEQLNASIAVQSRELSAAIQFSGTARAAGKPPLADDLPRLLERADQDFRNRNYPAAKAKLEQAQRLAPADPVVMERLGQAAFALEDLAAALAQFSRLAEIKPSEPSVFVHLAQIHLKLDQIGEFEVALSKALDLDPFHRDALGLLADLNLRNDRYQDAAQTLTKILSRYPDDLEALLPLGLCFFKLGDIETAKIVFERVLEKHPGNAIAQENLEIIRQKAPSAGRSASDAGISDFRVGRPETGSPPAGTQSPDMGGSVANAPAPVVNSERDLLVGQADDARKQGDLPTARRLFVEALRLSPDDPKILTVLGEVCYVLNEHGEAYRHLLRATEVHRTDPAIFLQFALVNLKLDQIEEFEVALGRALEIDPNYREALKVLADLNFQNGRTKDAAQTYTKILSRHPDDLEALLPLGVCFFKEGDFETARLVFERALERHPGNEIAKDNLAAIREKLAGQSLGILRPSGSAASASEPERKPPLSAFAIPKSAAPGMPAGDAAPNPKMPRSGSDDAATRASLVKLMDQANFFCEVGNREAALESLQEALELAPRDVQIRSALGSLHLTLGNHEAAREQFRRLIEIRPRDVDAYTRLAMACVKLDRIEEMEAALGLALEIDPDHREALKFLAKTNIENNRVRDAGRAYAKLLEKHPDDVESLLSLGLCFFRGGDLESARMVYSRVLEVDPNNLTARENLFQLDEYARNRFTGNLKTPAPAPPPPPLPEVKPSADSFSNLNRALAKADAAFGVQNLAEARDALKTALEFAPGSPEILSALSTVCFQLGDVLETRGYLQQLVGVLPTDPQKWVQLALSHYQTGDMAEYETALGRALALDPDHIEALRLQAQVDFNQGKIQEAARTFGKMLKQTPDDIEVLMPLGVCFFKVGDFETARSVFERLLEIDPHNALAAENLKSTQDKLAAQSNLTTVAPIVPKPGATTVQPAVSETAAEPSGSRPIPVRPVGESVSRANTLWAAGDLRGATTALREALNSEPDSHEMRATLGSLLFQMGELNASHEELAHATRLHPDSADYLTRLALALLGLQRVPEFESALGRALEVDPNHRPALRVLADLNFREGRFQDAASTYHKILLQAPDDIETMLPLAVCFFKTGDPDAAKMVFERVLAIDPQNAVARENLSVLTHPGGATPQNKSVEPAEPKPPAKKKTIAPERKLSVVWEGSQFVHHSLALINRELCLQLMEAGHDLSILPYEPDQYGPEADPRFRQIASRIRAPLGQAAQIHVRHQWPLNSSAPPEGHWVIIQPWEFGRIPKDWVNVLRDRVDEIWVPSSYVRVCYVESGIPGDKVFVVPNGTDPGLFHPAAPPLPIPSRKKFKFLFVGGTIRRKGPDLVLNAFLKRFTGRDDVCLVVKDFGTKTFYQGQTLEAQIRELQSRPNAPEIVYLNQDLPPDKVPGLYTACDCLVHPYRGEGFGLPILEAMACGLPVIITAGGAADDFTTDEIAYRIPAVRQNIGDKVGDLPLAGEGWLLEPDLDALGERMRFVASHPDDARLLGEKASVIVRKNWTWEMAATKAEERLLALAARTEKPLRHRSSARQSLNDSTKAEGNAAAGLVESLKTEAQTAAPAIEVPPAGRLGSLQKAQDLSGKKKYLKAWKSVLESTKLRPFHPDAYLQMVDITLAAGDERQAFLCAERLLEMTPKWDMAQRVYASLKPSAQGRRSAIKWTSLPPRTEKPRLSVCMIARDEEEHIGRCLASVKSIASQIVVVDTGSKDRTVEIARQHGAEVYHFTWNDNFADARNAAHEHARGDWVLILDADEELPKESHEKLARDMAAANVLGYRIPICNVHESSDSVTYVPRLFRNAPALFFVGRVHEQIYASVIARRVEWGMDAQMGTATIVHYGYDPGLVKRKQKIQRNLRLMERAVRELPNEAALIMNYGLDLVNDGRLEEGLVKYRQAFQIMAPHPAGTILPEVRERLLTIYGVHALKADLFGEVLEIMTSRLAADSGPTASMHFLAAVSLMQMKRPEEAIPHLEACLVKRDMPTLTPPCHQVFKAGPHHLLAQCNSLIGRHENAEHHYKRAMEIEPDAPGILHDYAHFLHRADRSLEALQTLHGAMARGISNEPIWHLGSFISASKPEFIDFAVDWTEEAAKHFPQHAGIRGLRGETLLKAGRFREAQPYFQDSPHAGEPAALAAVLMCRLAEGEIPEVRNVELEKKLSVEFVGWYRRLLSARSQQGIAKLNSKVDVLKRILPTAAAMLEQAFKEAGPE